MPISNQKILYIFCCLVFSLTLTIAPVELASSSRSPAYNEDGSLNWQYLLDVGQRCGGGISRELLLAIMWVESRMNPYAVNVNGVGGFMPSSPRRALEIIHRYNRANTDIGLMQVNYRWWGEEFQIRKVDLLNPSRNICIGAKILRQYLEDHNWSWRGIGRYNAVSPDKQVAYAKRVLRAYEKIKQIKANLPH